MKEQELIVMKFGGSSVANAERFCHAASIIRNYSQEHKVVVVVSAMQGVTDQLYGLVSHLKDGNPEEARRKIFYLQELHQNVGMALGRPLHESLNRFRNDLEGLVDSSGLSPSDHDFAVSYGERLSSILLNEAILRRSVSSQAIDASEVIIASNEYGNARVNIELSGDAANRKLHHLLVTGVVPVIGGFYGLSEEGKIAILGRGGSDYSAAILANVLNANRLILWKEVDGIFSSDPKKDPSAQFLPLVSYQQAKEMAKNGAKILHPECIEPLEAKNIPIEVKNYFNPNAPGSRINGKVNLKGGDIYEL